MDTSAFTVSISINEFDEGRPGKMLDTIAATVRFVRETFQVHARAERADDRVVLHVQGPAENMAAFQRLY